MSDFKFNFVVSDDEGDADYKESKDDFVQEDSSQDSGPEAREILWIPAQSPPPSSLATTRHTFGSHSLLTVSSAAVEESLLQQEPQRCQVAQAIAGHSDLVAGQYEGGLKVWECSLDLCHYLAEESGVGVEGGGVLEVGCGAGLPAMLACTMGARSAHFQDFNQEVLETYTMRNVELNGINPASLKFFYGDWSSFASLAVDQNHRYDLILTAETIYNVNSYPKLLKVFSSLLAKDGMVLVAAKSDYFGVGGGVSSFVHYLQQADPQFTVDVVRHVPAGLPRKILKLTRT